MLTGQEPSLIRLQSYADLVPDDVQGLMRLAGPPRPFHKGERLYHQNDRGARLLLLVDGWAVSSVELASGHRQLIKVHLPGDVAGFQTLPVGYASDTVFALTDGSVCDISLDRLGEVFERNPRLAAMLFLVSQEERLMFMDRLTTVGRMEAAGRFAGLVLQLRDRMRRSSPDTDLVLEMPLSQAEMADLIGVTNIHLGRTLKSLRADGLIRTERHRVEILDMAALRRLALLPERLLVRDPSWLPAPGTRPAAGSDDAPVSAG